jgi:hypothetical protein
MTKNNKKFSEEEELNEFEEDLVQTKEEPKEETINDKEEKK